MITSSNFFRKTLFGEEDDHRSDWVKEHLRHAAAPTKDLPVKLPKERALKPLVDYQPGHSIYLKETKRPALPVLTKETAQASKRTQHSNFFQAIYNPTSEQFNFLRLRRSIDHRRHDSLAAQRQKLRWNTIDQGARSTHRYGSQAPSPTGEYRRKSPLDTPDVNSRDFMKLVQERLNRIRLSFT